MTYIEKFESALAAKLTNVGCPADDVAETVQWVVEQIGRSYKNGLIAGRKRAEARNGEKSEKDSSAQSQ